MHTVRISCPPFWLMACVDVEIIPGMLRRAVARLASLWEVFAGRVLARGELTEDPFGGHAGRYPRFELLPAF